MINQISIIPLTINEPMMYIFYLMFLKLNKYKSYSDLFFIAKDYYAISFVVILLGSIILNEILVLPCFGLDKHTEEKILEEKMTKDINNVDNTKLNDFSNDNAQL